MKKRFLIWGLVLGFAIIIAIVWVSSQMQPPALEAATEAEMAAVFQKAGFTNDVPVAAPLLPLDSHHAVRLAIGGLGAKDDGQNVQLDDLVLADLTSAPGFELVERQSLEPVMAELNLGLSGLVRARDAVRVGKLLKVDWFLLGSRTAINGTNLLVVRLVDSRTGILRDAGVFLADKTPVDLAAGVAGFVRQSREDAATARPRVYLSIGGFEDFSVNDRQTEFPAQLRAYLTAAYRGSSVILLEREAADLLLQEVRLDLAGLTEGGGAPAPLQSAFWLVNGEYQSYETTNFQVEAKVDIDRMFGRDSVATFRGPPDETLFSQIKEAIDRQIKQYAKPVLISRMTETRAQMGIGKSLVPNSLPGYPVPMPNTEPYYENMGEAEIARLRRNMEAGIRAFETVLLLTPTNREAKMYLGYCLQTRLIDRPDEARNYYREVLDEPGRDDFSFWATQALKDSFKWGESAESARWFAMAAANTNSPAIGFYREEVKALAEAAVDAPVPSDSPEAVPRAEKHLRAALREAEKRVQTHDHGYGQDDGVYNFMKDLRGHQPGPGNLLAELTPALEKEFPAFKPFLLASVVSCQDDTNAPVIEEFRTNLDEAIQHPERLADVAHFWEDTKYQLCDWCFQKRDYSLAVQFLEGEHAAYKQGCPVFYDDKERTRLAYSYLGVQRWQDALAMFNSLQGRPVQMDSSGPWGGAFTMVPLDRLIAYCREKISPGSGTDPHAFTVKSTPIHSDYTFAFAPDSSGLWVAAGSVLMRLNLDLQTNVVIDLPMAQDVSSTTLQVGDAKIWVGTAGAGLIEVDLTTRQSRVFTEKDGLLMNDIRSLHADDGIIWIGYGNTVGGGLGRFELASRQARTFMASLGDKGTAPQGAIDDIVEVQAGHLLIKAGEGLWQFDTRSETWASVGNGFRCCAVDGDRFVRGTADPIQEYQFEHAPCSNPVAGMANSNAMVSLIPHGAVPERPFGPVFPPRHAGYVKQTVYGTMDELKKFMMTNAGWNILAEASGEEGYECGVSVRSGTNGEWQNFADAMAMPYAANAMNLDGENLWIGGEGYLTLLDLHRHTFRRLCSLQAVAVNKIKIGGGYVWLDYGQRLHRAALSQLP